MISPEILQGIPLNTSIKNSLSILAGIIKDNIYVVFTKLPSVISTRIPSVILSRIPLEILHRFPLETLLDLPAGISVGIPQIVPAAALPHVSPKTPLAIYTVIPPEILLPLVVSSRILAGIIRGNIYRFIQKILRGFLHEFR